MTDSPHHFSGPPVAEPPPDRTAPPVSHGPLRRLLAPLLGLLLLAAAALSGVCDEPAEDAVNMALKRALVTFAAARGLNAVISAAQGTEVSVTPFGMGVTLAPGEVLDPLNDLVERFSGFMLVSAVALGSQRVLLEMSSWLPFSIFLIAFGSVLVLARVASQNAAPRWRQQAWKIFCVLAVIRFVVPLALVGSEWLYQGFLENRHLQAEQGITQASERVQSINRQRGLEIPQAEEPGSWERLRDWAGEAKRKAGAAMQLERYSEALKQTAQDAIELMVVFFLGTFVFPVAIVLAIWQLGKWSLRRSAGDAA